MVNLSFPYEMLLDWERELALHVLCGRCLSTFVLSVWISLIRSVKEKLRRLQTSKLELSFNYLK